ncbi:MAG: MBL fold metallo-hydrolase [Deltaproteobacteria bacterium]|jgi:metallo-beta-lactamase family protein|nr:MBL fold metallo-hydrolase [Deltaproteobacteria bacterium]
MKIRCLGAVRTVTGSCYQLENPGGGLTLVDCGLFQGGRQTELRNFNTALYRPKEVQSIIITHAHIDHSGLVPRLVKAGFRGPIYATAATAELLSALWQDAASIQEQEALWKSRKNSRQGQPGVEVLYDREAALEATDLLKSVDFFSEIEIAGGPILRLIPAGHILGAAGAHLTVRRQEVGHKTAETVFFSGDIGRKGQLIIKDPEQAPKSDLIFMETTYGNRLHKDIETSSEELVGVINQAWSEGGKVLIPAFAVERTQEILVLLTLAWHEGRIPKEMPVFLDSPLAIAASEVFLNHPELYDQQTHDMIERSQTPFNMSSLKITRDNEDSQKINQLNGPAVIIAGSGMANAGRILHHLKHNLWRPNCHVVFVGFQSQGTTGRRLVEGAATVKIFREPVTVGAKIHTIGGFSAHADQNELLDWLRPQVHSKLTVALVHGEETGTLAFQAKLKEVFPALPSLVPRWLETLDVSVPMDTEAKPEVVEEISETPPVTEAEVYSLKSRLDRLYAQILERGEPLSPERLASLEDLLNQAEEIALNP